MAVARTKGKLKGTRPQAHPASKPSVPGPGGASRRAWGRLLRLPALPCSGLPSWSLLEKTKAAAAKSCKNYVVLMAEGR
jgi:hypothetical protein